VKNEFEFGGVSVAAGERGRGWIEVGERVDGTPFGIPFIAVNGLEPGPSLLVDGGTHGDEVETPLAVHQINEEVDANSLKGQLVLVPTVNVLALDAMQRTTPTHLIGSPDINRVFPGKEDGFLTERLAYTYLKQFIEHADYMISFHTGGLYYMEPPKVIYQDHGDEAGKISREMAKAFGWEIIWRNPGYL
jgi:uncharacterized protein